MVYINETENNINFFTKYNNSYLEQYDELFMLMYVYLHRHKSIEGYVNLTIKDFLLYHNYVPNRTKGRINSKICDILNLMVKKGFIQYIGCLTNDGLASIDGVNCDRMFTVQLINHDTNWNPESNFTKVMYSEIDKLRKNNVKFMGKALSLYINIKRYISCELENASATPFAYPSENSLSKKCNCGISTIKKFTKILCDIGMLYTKNYGSYLRMLKGKEVVVNSNNVYALEEKYLNDDAKDSLRKYLELNYGYIDGFFPFCNNLPNNNKTKSEKTNNDNWGEPNSMEKDFTIEEILDMPVESGLVSKSEESTMSKDTTVDVSIASMNPVKVITIKKKEQNREIPLDVKIQQYADDLYEKHGYGTEYEKSIFITELAEKFPGMDDYEKYYNSAKKLHDLSV